MSPVCMTLDDFADELDTQLADLRERSRFGVKVEILNRPDDWEEVELVDGVLVLTDHVGAEQVRITLADPGNLTPGLKWARARIRQLPTDEAAERHSFAELGARVTELEEWATAKDEAGKLSSTGTLGALPLTGGDLGKGADFVDLGGRPCSLQESSGDRAGVWLGRSDAEGRMLLSPENAAGIWPHLRSFAETGRLGPLCVKHPYEPEDGARVDPRWRRMDEPHPDGGYLFGSDPDQEEVKRYGFGAAAPVVPAWGFGPTPGKPAESSEDPAEWFDEPIDCSKA